MKSVGFKEWALVCDAIGRGEQTVILRKGGIAEGRDGFAFRHREFFLMPTFFHEQIGKTRLTNAKIPAAIEGEIALRYFVEIERMEFLATWEEVEALEPLHILTREVVRERFEYGEPHGLHVAWVKASTLEPPWIIADSKSYAGCRSWVELPDLPDGITLRRVQPDHAGASS